jgi:elongation factor Tu
LLDAPFLLPVENALTISGRGTAVTGAVERGCLRPGEPVELVGLGPAVGSVATGLATFGRVLEVAQAGDNAGVLLRGVRREQVRRGMVLAAPGTVSAHRRFRTRLHTLTRDEGGRHTPFHTDYRPQFFFRTTDVPGSLDLGGLAEVVPGEEADVVVALGEAVALEPGLGFAIRSRVSSGTGRSGPAAG